MSRAIALSTAAIASLAMTLAVARPARADAGDKARAAQEFQEGSKAFKAGDFRRAGDLFEAAYRDSPHYSPLWNAGKSWEKAGEPVRAANLYARYLREAPPNARDRDNATKALKQLATQLGRLEVHAPGFDTLTVDDAALDDASVYVNPGEHVVAGKYSDHPARKSVTVRAGEVMAVTLDPPSDPATAPPSDGAPTPTAEPTAGAELGAAPRHSGWSPIVVYVGAGVTALGAGLTIWSGLDTQSQKKAFDAAPTQANLDAGRSKESRTNVFLGVSVVAAAFTVVAAALADWKAGDARPATQDHASLRLGVDVGWDRVVVKGAF